MNTIVTTPKDILMNLGLTPTEADIYICMMNGLRTAKEIIKHTNLKRPTVYYALTNLEHRGLISKKNNHLDHEYAVSSLNVLSGLAEAKRMASEDLVEQVSKLIPIISNTISSKDSKPSVAFYEGVETIKNIVLGTAYSKSKKIMTIIPGTSFFWNIETDFLNEYVERRVKNGIRTQSLWERRLGKDTFTKYYKNISDVKILPDNMHKCFSTSIFIYDDKVMYISSIENAYCIIVTSKEHCQTMSALFKGIWDHAKKY